MFINIESLFEFSNKNNEENKEKDYNFLEKEENKNDWEYNINI